MINLNQIQSFETWQEAFDGVKRAVDEYHMKFWEELEKMTKIDESKKYKFSEIVAMLENSELPEGTKLYTCSDLINYHYVGEGEHGAWLFNRFGCSLQLSSLQIVSNWTIELPKEDKFYLKLPDCFVEDDFLNYNKRNDSYFLDDKGNNMDDQTHFTKKEIDAMPFDTNFFKKIKVEDNSND